MAGKGAPFADTLLGDWGGLRTALKQRGVEAKVLLISDPYGNTTGGQATERASPSTSEICGRVAWKS